MIPFPDKRYSIIYADPPWTYRDKARAGKRGVEFKYQTMTLDEIKSLPVESIAADDSVLFMWVTFPQLAEGLETMKAWGFKYKTIGFTWVKLNRRYGEHLDNSARAIIELEQSPESVFRIFQRFAVFMGMGNWTRSNAEICLMGVRGKPKRINAGVRSVILSPIREHSQKPDEVRNRIVKLMGNVPRIELFARTTALGWDAWGNEVNIPVLSQNA